MIRQPTQWEKAGDDDHYRSLVAQGKFPPSIRCPACGRTAHFRNDKESARYVCAAHHEIPAPLADPDVNPRWAELVVHPAFRETQPLSQEVPHV